MIAYLLTGVGITQYRTIESLTFGSLSKNLSFKIHENLLVPLLTLVTVHILFRQIIRIYLKTKKIAGTSKQRLRSIS